MQERQFGIFDFLILIFIVIIAFSIFKANSGVEISEDFKKNALWEEATSKSKPVFVYFYGDYCGTCVKFKPLVYQVAEEFKSQYTFLAVDVTDPNNRSLAQSFNIRAIPGIFLVDHLKGKSTKLKLYFDAEYFRKELEGFRE